MRPNVRGIGVSANDYSCAQSQGAQINFEDLMVSTLFTSCKEETFYLGDGMEDGKLSQDVTFDS